MSKLSPNGTMNKQCIDLRYTQADAVQICGKFWDTQYGEQRFTKMNIYIDNDILTVYL